LQDDEGKSDRHDKYPGKLKYPENAPFVPHWSSWSQSIRSSHNLHSPVRM